MAVRQLRTSAVPSSAPAPRRSARNASQTPSLHATPEKGIRTTRRQVRGSSVEQADDHNDAESDHELESGTVTRLTRRLHTIIESSPDDESEIHSETAVVDARQESPTASVASVSSGLTQPTIEELRANSDTLRRSFQDLYDYSLRILQRINRSVQRGVTLASVRDDLERDAARVKNFEDTFEPFAREFYLIRPDIVERALFDSDVDATLEEHSSLAEPLLVANLAKLMLDIVRVDRDGSSRLIILQRLDNVFPRAFRSTQHSLNEKTAVMSIGDTFDVALAIRTQVAITLLRDASLGDDSGADPDVILRDIFLNSERTPVSREILRTWSGAEDLQDEAGLLLEEFVSKTITRMSDIHGCFRDDDKALSSGDYVDFDRLEKAFPWDYFVQKVNLWAFARQKEFVAEINRDDGILKVVDELNQRIERKDAQTVQDAAQHSLSPSAANTMNIDTEANTSIIQNPSALLKQMRHSSGGRFPQPSSSIVPRAEPTTSALPMRNDNSSPVKQPQQTISRLVGGIPGMEQPKQPHKRSLLDRQAGAVRLAEIDVFGPATQDSVRQTSEAVTPVLSATPASQGTFQTDTRPTNTRIHKAREAVRARAASPQSAQAPSELPQVAQVPVRSTASPAANSVQASAAHTVAKSPSKAASKKRPCPTDGDDIKDGTYAPAPTGRPLTEEDGPDGSGDADIAPGDVPPATDFQSIQRNVKRARTAGPQKREAWSPAEENALIYYIKKHRTSWTTMMDDDADGFQLLQSRGQVALKDKARNMKFVYLKEGVPLPPNFEHVGLTTIHRANLQAMGVNV